ncbi:MAG: hypothetical protein SOZ40_04225 [Ezakiella sp.]|nr:hypothetical protein [Ezakiella sp.]
MKNRIKFILIFLIVMLLAISMYLLFKLKNMSDELCKLNSRLYVAESSLEAIEREKNDGEKTPDIGEGIIMSILEDDEHAREKLIKFIDFTIAIGEDELFRVDTPIEVSDRLIVNIKFNEELFKYLQQIAYSLNIDFPGRKQFDLQYDGLKLENKIVDKYLRLETYEFSVIDKNNAKLRISDFAKEFLGLSSNEFDIIKINR